MVKVFLSYKHETTDTVLVHRLAEELSQGRHDVFFDRTIPPGVRFAAYIEKHLRACDIFVVLVTKAAHESEWIRTELSVANEIARQCDGRPRVIGLLLEQFPWDIEWRVYLDKWQHVRCLDQAKDWDRAVATIRKELDALDGAAHPQVASPLTPVEPVPGPRPLSEPFVKSLERVLDVARQELKSRQFQQALDLLRSCEGLTEQPGGTAPVEMRLRLYNDSALALASLRQTDEALQYLARAGHLLAEHDLPALRADYEHRLGYIHLQKREVHDALKHLEVAEMLSREHGLQDLAGQVQDMLGTAWSALGVLDVALEHYQNSLATKQATGDLLGQAITHGNLGRSFHRLGDFWRARAHFEKDLEICRQLHDYDGAMLMRSHLAGLLREELRFAESLRAYQDYLRLAEEHQLMPHVAFAHLGLAQVRLALGEAEEAEKHLRAADQFTASWFQPFLLRVKAHLASSSKEPARAIHLFYRAVEAFEKAGGQPQDLVETLGQLAQVLLRDGREADARAALQRAHALARLHRMRWLVGRLHGLEAQLFLHRGSSYQKVDMPFPAALMAARLDAAYQAAERVDALLEFFKVLLKYAASIALAEYVALQPALHKPELDALIAGTFDRGRPSTGHWAQVLRTLVMELHNHQERLQVPELLHSFAVVRGRRPRLRKHPQKCIDRFLELRNQFSHLRQPDPEEQRLIVHELDGLLAPFAEVLQPVWGYRLRACQQYGDGKRWRELVGSASLLNWPSLAGEVPSQVRDGDVFLCHPERASGLLLSPVWVVRWREDRDARGELLLFSKRAHQQGVYVDVETRSLHRLPATRFVVE